MPKRILVKRELGGIGDILMHRPLFKSLKERFVGCEVTFAVLEHLIPLVKDHPYIDKVIGLDEAVKGRYDRTFSTLGKAAAYEFSKVPFVDRHRSELWAAYMGIGLPDFDDHIKFSEKERQYARRFFSEYGGRKIGLAPVSAHPSKDIPRETIQEAINTLSGEDYCCFIFHSEPLNYEGAADVNVGIREWMALTNELDVVITVATAMFHVANLLHIPTVAIFGVENLDVFGKFFPEMISIQRTRVNPDWPFCPCWNGLDCKLRPLGERSTYPLPCLQSITADEICNGVRSLLNVHL